MAGASQDFVTFKRHPLIAKAKTDPVAAEQLVNLKEVSSETKI